MGQRELLGFHSLQQRKAALPPFHRQFNPIQPPALSPLPQKSPLACTQQRQGSCPHPWKAQAQAGRDDKSHFYPQMFQLQTCTSPGTTACASRETPHPCRYRRAQDISDHPHCQKQTFTWNPREEMNTESQNPWCWKQPPCPSRAQGLPTPSVGAGRKLMAQPEPCLLQGKLVRQQQLKEPLYIL